MRVRENRPAKVDFQVAWPEILRLALINLRTDNGYERANEQQIPQTA